MATTAEQIVAGLGGIGNLTSLRSSDHSITVDVFDISTVDETLLKAAGVWRVRKIYGDYPTVSLVIVANGNVIGDEIKGITGVTHWVMG